MNVRDRLLYRALIGAVAMLVGVAVVQAVVPVLRPMLWLTIPNVGLAGGALYLVHIGYGRASAWAMVGVGGLALAVQLMFTGGSESEHAPYMVLAIMSYWIWLGRKVALGALGLFVLTMLLTDQFGPASGPRDPLDMLVAYTVSLVMAFGFVWMVSRDLRLAAETAWQRAAEAEQSAAAASAADEARDRFLATVSHELRTPLDAILGYAELLREEEEDPDRIIDLQRIHAAGRQLLSLVDDLLDMSRVRTEELTLRFELLPVSAVVEEVVQTTQPLASARGNRLVVKLPGELPRLLCDRGRLRQILLNLVSNSIKYTSDGEITLEAELLGAAIALSVRDSGIGIPPEKLSQLFQPFVQLHEGTDRRPGMGLGLALSQQLAAHLGGHIEASSVVGKGSVFTLYLPLLQQGGLQMAVPGQGTPWSAQSR
jgi:signal transduction histidine kinase